MTLEIKVMYVKGNSLQDVMGNPSNSQPQNRLAQSPPRQSLQDILAREQVTRERNRGGRRRGGGAISNPPGDPDGNDAPFDAAKAAQARNERRRRNAEVLELAENVPNVSPESKAAKSSAETSTTEAMRRRGEMLRTGAVTEKSALTSRAAAWEEYEQSQRTTSESLEKIDLKRNRLSEFSKQFDVMEKYKTKQEGTPASVAKSTNEQIAAYEKLKLAKERSGKIAGSSSRSTIDKRAESDENKYISKAERRMIGVDDLNERTRKATGKGIEGWEGLSDEDKMRSVGGLSDSAFKKTKRDVVRQIDEITSARKMALKKSAPALKEGVKEVEESLFKSTLSGTAMGVPYMMGLPLGGARALTRVMATMGPALPIIGGAAIVAGAGYAAYRESQKLAEYERTTGAKLGGAGLTGHINRAMGDKSFGATGDAYSSFGLGTGYLLDSRKRAAIGADAASFAGIMPMGFSSQQLSKFSQTRQMSGMSGEDLAGDLSRGTKDLDTQAQQKAAELRLGNQNEIQRLLKLKTENTGWRGIWGWRGASAGATGLNAKTDKAIELANEKSVAGETQIAGMSIKERQRLSGQHKVIIERTGEMNKIASARGAEIDAAETWRNVNLDTQRTYNSLTTSIPKQLAGQLFDIETDRTNKMATIAGLSEKAAVSTMVAVDAEKSAKEEYDNGKLAFVEAGLAGQKDKPEKQQMSEADFENQYQGQDVIGHDLYMEYKRRKAAREAAQAEQNAVAAARPGRESSVEAEAAGGVEQATAVAAYNQNIKLTEGQVALNRAVAEGFVQTQHLAGAMGDSAFERHKAAVLGIEASWNDAADAELKMATATGQDNTVTEQHMKLLEQQAKNAMIVADGELKLGERAEKIQLIGASESAAATRRTEESTLPGLGGFRAQMGQLANATGTLQMLKKQRGELPEKSHQGALLDEQIRGQEDVKEGIAAHALYEMGERGFSPRKMANEARRARKQVEKGLRRRDQMLEEDLYDKSHQGKATYNDPDIKDARNAALGNGKQDDGGAAALMMQAAQLMMQSAQARGFTPGRGGGRDFRAMGAPTN